VTRRRVSRASEVVRSFASLPEQRAVLSSEGSTSPADAVALSLALDASSAERTFSEVATNYVRARAHANVRPGQSIFLYSWGRSWRAPGTTIP
jgi:hypothetical protein